MTTLRQAFEMTTEEAIETLRSYYYNQLDKAADVLEAALAAQPVMLEEHCLWARNGNQPCPHVQQAEPVQEPVAWAVYDIKHGGSKTLHWPEQHSPNGDPSQFKAVPLYTAPPKTEQPWVGLTDEEYSNLHDGLHQQGKSLGWVVDQIEAILKERNT